MHCSGGGWCCGPATTDGKVAVLGELERASIWFDKNDATADGKVAVLGEVEEASKF